MGGQGSVTVSQLRGGSETAPVKMGDAIPIQLGDIHSFANTGGEPLEFMIVGISRDGHKIDTIDVPAGGMGPGRGGR